MKLSFIGDIALNDAYVRAKENQEDLFSSIGEYLKQSDEVIANIECTCESNQGENELKKPRIKTSLNALNYIKDIGVTIGLLANNHIYDNFDDGFFKTKQFLENNNIQTTGAGIHQEEYAKPIFIEKNGIKVCILNYVHKNTNPKPYEGSKVILNYFSLEKIIAEIKQYKAVSNHVIIVPHWGGDYECGSYPNPIQTTQAQQFIDAGASAVIGHHSHTLQPYEYYKEKPIFHSLGNFCFANIEQFGHEVSNKLGKESVIVELDISTDGLKTSFTPIVNRNLNITIDKTGKVNRRLKRRNKQYQKLRANSKLFKLYGYKHRFFDTFYFFFFGNKRYFFDRLKYINFTRIKYFLLRK